MNKVSKALRLINSYFEKEKELIDKITKNSIECVTVESLKKLMFVLFKYMKVNPVSVDYMVRYKTYVIRFYFKDTRFFMRLCFDDDIYGLYDDWGWLEIFSEYYNSDLLSRYDQSNLYGYSLTITICSYSKESFGISSVSDYAVYYDPIICRLLVYMEDAVESVFLKKPY